MPSITGIHHVAAVATDYRSTLAFYEDALGLTVIGRTVEPETQDVLRVYLGKPGAPSPALISFSFQPGRGRGRTGMGHASAISLAVPSGSLPGWRLRLSRAGVGLLGRAWSFREEHLCFADPDGLELSLVEVGVGAGKDRKVSRGRRSVETGIVRVRSIELQVETLELAARFLVDGLGFRAVGRDGAALGFQVGDEEGGTRVDLLSVPDRTPGSDGAGIVTRVAWRVAGMEALKSAAARLAERSVEVSPLKDEVFFTAAYFCSICKTGMALVTESRGFGLRGGRGPAPSLALPVELEPRRTEIERLLAEKYGIT